MGIPPFTSLNCLGSLRSRRVSRLRIIFLGFAVFFMAWFLLSFGQRTKEESGFPHLASRGSGSECSYRGRSSPHSLLEPLSSPPFDRLVHLFDRDRPLSCEMAKKTGQPPKRAPGLRPNQEVALIVESEDQTVALLQAEALADFLRD